MTNNTALQITDFNFYGDELIALKDNSTGEIYTSINSVLRGIGFTDKNQIRKRRDKWINDSIISKGVLKFNIPTQEVVTKNGTTIFDDKDTYCISQHKLPLALAKINITPNMKKNQPELATKLELYQDKCADVLASVFIDKKSTDNINTELLAESISKAISTALQPINDRLSKLEEQSVNSVNTSNATVQNKLPNKKYKSRWLKNTFDKLNLLLDYLKENESVLPDILKPKSNKKLNLPWIIHIVINQAESMNENLDFNEYKERYEYENQIECNSTMDFIEYYSTTKDLFSETLDLILSSIGIKLSKENTKTILEELILIKQNTQQLEM